MSFKEYKPVTKLEIIQALEILKNRGYHVNYLECKVLSRENIKNYIIIESGSFKKQTKKSVNYIPWFVVISKIGIVPQETLIKVKLEYYLLKI